MRRLIVVSVVLSMLVVPFAVAGAEDGCHDFAGTARLDYGKTLTGTAKVVYDGVKVRIDFVQTGFVPTGPNTADVNFDWFFPEGTVSIVEHSITTPINGPKVAFDSTIDVLSGATGTWTWSGTSNVAAGKAWFDLEGTVCFGP